MNCQTETLLPLPYADTAFAIHAKVEEWELPHQEKDGELWVELEDGFLTITPNDMETKVQLTCKNEAHLQTLKDFLTEQFEAFGLSANWSHNSQSKRPANHTFAQVEGVEKISQSFFRVTLRCSQIDRFEDNGLHFRLLQGAPGADWPSTDENGVTRWPGGPSAWHKPVYTIRELWREGDEGFLSFDVFIHRGGRTTEWAQTVQKGDTVVLSGPGGSNTVRNDTWQAFVGDETALPVIARMLEKLPANAVGEATIFVPNACDVQDIPHPEGVDLHWAVAKSRTDQIETLNALTIPDTDRYVFFASEATLASEARQLLLKKGLKKTEFTAATYWTLNSD